MRQTTVLFFALGLSAFIATAVAACGGTNRGSQTTDAKVDAAVPEGGATTPPVFGDVDGGLDASGGRCGRCSADLRSFVDCDTGDVIQTCPDGQGCGPGGTCVSPCESARENKSSIGCDYYAVTPDGWSNIPEYYPGTSDGSCFAAFVTNTWSTPVDVTLEFDGQTIAGGPHAYIPQGSGTSITYQPLPNGVIPPGQMAIVFLAQRGSSALYKTACPFGTSPAITNVDTGQHGTGIGKAIRLTTSAPTVVYDIYPFGGASSYITSATLLLPTSVWETNYIGATTSEKTLLLGTLTRPSGLTIVAQEDGTTVTISPTNDVTARGAVKGAPKGVPTQYALNKGQLLHLMQGADLTGTPIQSNHPVGVWGQHYCMQIPDTSGACDPGHQQIPPVKALGSEYVAVRYRNRSNFEEGVPWRLVGAVDGTTLTYDPPQNGAPAKLASGELAVFTSSGPFVVKSQDAQHPFYMAAHMTGASTVPASGLGSGDPETVNIIPPEQYLSKYVFFADPTYGWTNLVLVRAKGPNGYADVTLDCAGALSGWQPIGSSNYEFTRLDLQLDRAKVGTCDNGRHEISSPEPFGLTVWGWDAMVSYAYPAGASVRPINSVVVPAVPK